MPTRDAERHRRAWATAALAKDPDEGGDPAGWVGLFCPECGAVPSSTVDLTGWAAKRLDARNAAPPSQPVSLRTERVDLYEPQAPAHRRREGTESAL
jgi:hypothetical protein